MVDTLNKPQNKKEDSSKILPIGLKIMMNSSENIPNRPLIDNNIVLLCNGVIYNSEELFNQLEMKPKTSESYEIIIHLYKKFGIEYTLQVLDGIFSFILLDNNVEIDNFKLFVARDPYGVKPLYILNPIIDTTIIQDSHHHDEIIIGFSTDKNILHDYYKVLTNIQSIEPDLSGGSRKRTDKNRINYELKQFIPGTYSYFILPSKVFSSWIVKKENVKYFQHGYNSLLYDKHSDYDDSKIMENIQKYLIRSIDKRCKHYKMNFACYLDGRVGSSMIAGLLKQYCDIHKIHILQTYSIGLFNSDTLKQTKRIAEQLGSKHTEIIITENDLKNECLENKELLNSYYGMDINDSAVSAAKGSIVLPKSFPVLSLLAKAIRNEEGEVNVLFNGIGLDEIFGEFNRKTCNLNSINYDFLVKKNLANLFLDECMSLIMEKNHINYCSPFLDTSFVNYMLSIPPQIRCHNIKTMDKYLIREAFAQDFFHDYKCSGLLPGDLILDME